MDSLILTALSRRRLEQELSLPGEPTIRLAVMVTILLSIFAHGLSANRGISLYTRAGRGPSEPAVSVSVAAPREV